LLFLVIFGLFGVFREGINETTEHQYCEDNPTNHSQNFEQDKHALPLLARLRLKKNGALPQMLILEACFGSSNSPTPCSNRGARAGA
jgi:hypothetical protein